MAGVRWDRWVVPPALSAAVFAVLAVSPPLGVRPASSRRLEALGEPRAGRPWLLRARALTEAGRPLRLDSPDATVVRAAALAGQGEWFVVGVPARATALRLRVSDEAGARVLLVTPAPRPRAESAAPPDERVMVVEGTLVPELPGEVIVRPGGASVELRPVTEQVAIDPARMEVDACGLASFEVRVSGLGAPVSMLTTTAAGVRRDELRLPLVAGGVAVSDEGEAVVVRATSPGGTAHVVVGDAVGPAWWTAAPLSADGEVGRARVALPPGSRWVLASAGSDLRDATSPLVRPTGAPCTVTPLGRRLARGRLAPPALPPLRVLWDGPSDDARLTRHRVRRARLACAAGLATSVALEVVLLLGAGLERGPSALRSLRGDRRQRVGVLAAGISTLLLMGAALALAVGLRAP